MNGSRVSYIIFEIHTPSHIVHPWHPPTDTWHPQFSFSHEDIDLLSDLNINVIRLGIQWPGVEPVRGEFNQTYLDVIKSIIAECQSKVSTVGLFARDPHLVTSQSNLRPREFTFSSTFIKIHCPKSSVVKVCHYGL